VLVLKGPAEGKSCFLSYSHRATGKVAATVVRQTSNALVPSASRVFICQNRKSGDWERWTVGEPLTSAYSHAQGTKFATAILHIHEQQYRSSYGPDELL
jgi:hypothetical protein